MTAPDLSDPVVVHANMLRGAIAKPTVEQIIHLYGREAFQPMIYAAVAKALEDACLAVSEHADWPEDEHGRTEQVELFARVINAIRAITPAVTQPAPDPAAIREAALMKGALEYYADQFCEGFCQDMPDLTYTDENCERDCGGCKARSVLALISKGTAEPTEYERKVAQMKKDFPNGI